MVSQRSRSAIAGTACLLALLGSAGCATDTEPAKPESQGFRWAGTGEPGNFANDYQFCRRLLASENLVAIPGMQSEFPGQSAAAGFPAQRQFWDCMQGRGWALIGGPEEPSAT